MSMTHIQRIENNDPNFTELNDYLGGKINHIERFAKALAANRYLTKINLEACPFDNPGGISLASALKVNSALTDLNLSRCDLRDITVLAEALTHNRVLTRLNLSSNTFGNAGGIALAKVLLSKSALTDLNLYCCDLTDITALAEALQSNQLLSKLNFHGNKFGNTGGVVLAKALRVHRAVTELNLYNCHLTVITELADMLKTNHVLLRLNLSANKFGNAGLNTLAGALKENTALQGLVLQHCELSDITEFANALEHNCSLSSIDFGVNEFGTKGGAGLANALKVNNTLTDLNLWNCHVIDVSELAETLKTNHSLTRLTFMGNHFGNLGGKALASALELNVALTDLNLYECNLTDITELAGALTINRALRCLNLSHNKFGNAGSKALANALKVNVILTDLDLSFCELKEISESGGLAEGLRINRSLTRLRLSGNKLGDAGGYAILNVLRSNSNLVDLGYCGRDECGRYENDIFEQKKQNIALKAQAKKCEDKEKKPAAGSVQATTASAAGSDRAPAPLKVEPKLVANDRKANEPVVAPAQMRTALGGGSNLATLKAARLARRSIEITVIVQRVENNDPGVTDLDFTSQHLIDLTHFAKALINNHYVSKLRMGGNAFGNAGGIALAGVLRTNRVLTEINLNSCDLSDIKELAEALTTNNTLARVGLGWNGFGNAGGMALARTLKVNTAITHLNLNSCDLTEIKEFAEAISINRHVTKIDLGNNPFGNAGGRALKAALNVNKTLTELNIALCEVDRTFANEIAEKIKFNGSKSPTKPNDRISREPLLTLPQQPTASALVRSNPNATTIAAAGGNSSVAALDTITIAQLKALPMRHAVLASTVEQLAVLDTATLNALKGRSEQLQRIFEEDRKAVLASSEKDLIHANPHLQIYYQFFARLLNGTWMACQTISSGMVANAETYRSDYVGQGLDQIGARIPGIGLATGFLSGAIKAWNYREKQRAVQRMTLLFPDPDVNDAFKKLNAFARQVTLAQRNAICALPAPQTLIDKIKEGAKDLASYILASDADTPLKRKAEEDCKKLLTAIKQGEFPPQLSDMFTSIVGVGIKYEPSVSAIEPAAKAPTVAVAKGEDPNVADKLREIEAELKRTQAELRTLRNDDEEHAVFGENTIQPLVSSRKTAHRSSTSAPSRAAQAAFMDRVQNVETRSDVHTAKLDEQANEIAFLKAKLRQFEAQKKK